MAGYQNEKGYSGKDVDRILQDHDIKATTTLLSLSPTSPSEPNVGTVNLEGFPHGDTFPNAKYSYTGTTIKFMREITSGISNWITAAITSVTEITGGLEFLLFFQQKDSTKIHYYEMIITVNTSDWAAGAYRITQINEVQL